MHSMELKTVYNDLKGIGIAEHDAALLADCIVKNKSCSWINNDRIDKDNVKGLLNYIKNNSIPIELSIKHLETREKYIWEVKAVEKK
jgi:hypothetical protein